VTARENLTQLEVHLGVAPAASPTQVIVVQMPRREAASEWDELEPKKVPVKRQAALAAATKSEKAGD
jgi:hypothetical protein